MHNILTTALVIFTVMIPSQTTYDGAITAWLHKLTSNAQYNVHYECAAAYYGCPSYILTEVTRQTQNFVSNIGARMNQQDTRAYRTSHLTVSANKLYRHRNYHRKRNNAYQLIRHQLPLLTRVLLHDLMQVEGYSDIAIGFGAGISLDIIRNILAEQTQTISRKTFFSILGLYARVFCSTWRICDDDIPPKILTRIPDKV